MSIAEDATAMLDELVRLRRDLHRRPELGLHLPHTQDRVQAALDGLPLEITRGRGLTSLTAVLRGAAPGPTVLLRGDMDALPVTERTGLDYAATGDTMHACGHDLHTAMLVGAAHLLSARRDRLAGDVVFMFQPGEEGHDGAGHMIAEGVLEASGNAPAAAFALHVLSAGLPPGRFVTRRGPFLSAADVLTVTVNGRGGHGSMPHRASDPIPAACEMVLSLQTMVTRRVDITDPAVITVGAFHAGTQDNVIPERARFEATVRTFSPATQALVKDAAVRLVRGIAEAHDLRVDVDYADQYPVTVNDDAEAEFAADVIRRAYGEERFGWAPHPLPASEDFSRVLEAVPGAFVALGAGPPGADPERAANNHSPLAVFDDGVLADGAALYARLAIDRLG